MELSYIYIIQNKINNKFYLGSTNDLNKRKREHFNRLKKNIHHSIILQNAYNKYGKDNFDFKLFQICFKHEKLELENYYLKLYKPIYNISKSAFSVMEGRKHSEETKAKFKLRKTLKGKDSYNYGKKWTEEFRLKVLTIRKNQKYKHSNETKEKMRKTSIKLNRKKDLEKVREKQMKKIRDSNGNIFKSMVECSKFWEISAQTVCDILKGRHYKTRKGIKFFYE